MDINKEMQLFKKRKTVAPNISKYKDQYNPLRHEVFIDRHNFPDKDVEVEYEDENGILVKKIITIPLNRIALPYQKYITKIAVTFLYGNPVVYENNSKESDFYDSFRKVVEKNKMKFVDRQIAEAVSKFTECAEFWYDFEGNEDYGFDSVRTLKVKILTPDKEKLFPIFDSRDDLISFGREFKVVEDELEYEMFIVYTKEKIITFTNKSGEFTKTEETNPINKIPIIYYYQPEVEWEDVQSAIHRLEKIYMNSAESNDKFAFPILSIYGEVQGTFNRDRSGKILQFKNPSDRAEFVLPPEANQNVKDEVARLDEDIHTFTNTPNVFSLGKIEGLGNMLGGENAKFIFLSAHLKVMEKTAIYEPALQRRVSVIKAFLQKLNTKFSNKDLDVTPVITPFVIDNQMEYARFLQEMTGSKAVFSVEYALSKLNVKDPGKILEQLNSEAEKQASNSF